MIQLIQLNADEMMGPEPPIEPNDFCFVAGGAVRRWFTGEEDLSDVDLFAEVRNSKNQTKGKISMPRQQSLPGVGPKQIPEIEDAAQMLRELRNQRQGLAESEEKAQQALAELLKKHGYTGKRKYVFEIEDDESKMVKFDAFIERPEARAYVRKHRDPKEKDDNDSDDKAETGGDD